MAPERFYRLKSPDETSDYAQAWVNGELKRPFGLPAIRCRRCAQTWTGWRVLPFALPRVLEMHPKLRDRSPLDDAEHAALRLEVKQAFASEGARIEPLAPGDSFVPSHWSIPTIPEDDFLWPDVTPIVSAKVRDALVAIKATGIAFVPVVPSRIGGFSPRDAPRVPASGEPEDLMTEAPIVEPNDPRTANYYEMVIAGESGAPPGCVERARCSACGRVEFNTSKRRFEMTATMWRGHDVFYMATTRYIFVTARVRDAIENAGATRFEVRPGSKLAEDLEQRAKDRRARIGAVRGRPPIGAAGRSPETPSELENDDEGDDGES